MAVKFRICQYPTTTTAISKNTHARPPEQQELAGSGVVVGKLYPDTIYPQNVQHKQNKQSSRRNDALQSKSGRL